MTGIKDFFPVKKNGKQYCPTCGLELTHKIPKSMLTQMSKFPIFRGHVVGSEGYEWICKCGFRYYEPIAFYD
jgi:hypothetical protein